MPLEVTHGAKRVSAIYVTGIIAGRIEHSREHNDCFLSGCFDRAHTRALAGAIAANLFNSDDVVVLGASGGVYALLAAHVVDLLQVALTARILIPITYPTYMNQHQLFLSRRIFPGLKWT